MSQHFSQVEIIYNPNSTGNSRQAAQTLKKELVALGTKHQINLVATKRAGHAEELAYELAIRLKNPLLISSSGDGGYHEIVNGAMRAKAKGAEPVCAVLPAGNANDHFNDVIRGPLAELIHQEKVYTIDLLKVEVRSGNKTTTRYGHSYLGLGLTPVVAIELNRHRLSALKEMWVVIRGFSQFRPFKIETDGKLLVLDSLIISNIGRMAKMMSFERSELDDGVFEITVLPHAHKLRLLGRLLQAATTGLKPSAHAREYRFKALKRMPLQIDGEILTLSKGEVVTITSARKVLDTLVA